MTMKYYFLQNKFFLECLFEFWTRYFKSDKLYKIVIKINRDRLKIKYNNLIYSKIRKNMFNNKKSSKVLCINKVLIII